MLTIQHALPQVANEACLSVAFTITDAAAWAPGKKLGLFLVEVVFVHLLLTAAPSPWETDAPVLVQHRVGAWRHPQVCLPCLKCITIWSSSSSIPRSASAMTLLSVCMSSSQRRFLNSFRKNQEDRIIHLWILSHLKLLSEPCWSRLLSLNSISFLLEAKWKVKRMGDPRT